MHILAVLFTLATPALPQDAASYPGDFEFMWKTVKEKCSPDLLKLKGVDWERVRKEYEPRVKEARTDEEFVRLCAEVLGKLRDGHAYLECASIGPERLYPTEDRWNPGVGLIECKGGTIAILSVDAKGDAAAKGLKKGTVVRKIDGEDASKVAEKRSGELWNEGYVSSERAARHKAVWTLLRGKKDSEVEVEVETDGRAVKTFVLKRSSPPLLRCPKLGDYGAPDGLKQEGACSYAALGKDWGYLYIPRFEGQDGGRAAVEKILKGLEKSKGLIVDIRGNGGGGVPDVEWPADKPVVLIIDPGTLSAGEGFAAYFGSSKESKAHPNLKVIGRATAGSSSAKTSAAVPSGLFSFHFSTRGRKGVVNCGPGGMIEYYGVRPDEEVWPDVDRLRKNRDACVDRAVELLEEKVKDKAAWPTHGE